MDSLTTVAVIGSPFSERFILIAKLLEHGYKVKGPDGEFMYGDVYIDWERLYYQSCDQDDVDYESMLSAIIPGCDAVVCSGFVQDNGAADNSTESDNFASLVDMSTRFGVRRLICVPCFGPLQEDKGAGCSGNSTADPFKRSSESISLFEEYLPEVASDGLTTITVRSDHAFVYAPQKKLELIISVFQAQTIETRRVTVFASKRERITTDPRGTHQIVDHGAFPDRWYQETQSGISHIAMESMFDICLYLLGDSVKDICAKFWPHLVSGQIHLNRYPALRRNIALKERPYFPVVLNIRRRIARARWVMRRLFDVFMMMILFHIWPEQTYRFSTRNLLPGKANRLSMESKPEIPYELMEAGTSDILRMKEINLIGRGSSFDIRAVEKLDGPIYLISFWSPIESTRDVTYVMARKRVLKLLKEMDYRFLSVHTHGTDKSGKRFPMTDTWETSSYRDLFSGEDKCIAIAETGYCPPLLPPFLHWTPTGSVLPAVCGLSFFAERTNVYGWDFYLESSPEDMSYWQLFFNMYKYKPDINRSRNHFECAMLNFYYGYHLSRLPNIKVHGYLGKLERHERLIRRIERVLFNP